MKTWFVALRAFVYVSSFVLFFRWLALGVRRFDPVLGIVLPLWARVVGIVLMGAGGLLVLMCVGVFIVWGSGTPAVFDVPREFV